MTLKLCSKLKNVTECHVQPIWLRKRHLWVFKNPQNVQKRLSFAKKSSPNLLTIYVSSHFLQDMLRFC